LKKAVTGKGREEEEDKRRDFHFTCLPFSLNGQLAKAIHTAAETVTFEITLNKPKTKPTDSA